MLKYYASYNLFAFANGMFGIFINILFFTRFSLLSVMEYQAAIQTTQTIMFILSGYMLRTTNARTLFSIGTVMRSFIIFGMVFLKGPFYVPYTFGLLYGIPSGVFWAGNNTLSQAITRKVNRFNFLSTNSAISNLAGLLAPLIAGFIVSESPGAGIARYRIDFVISALLLIAAGLIAMTIRETGERRKSFGIRDTVIDNPDYLRFKIYFFLSNMLTIAISTFTPVYIFYLTHSYIIAGLFGTFLAIIAVSSNLSSIYLQKRIGSSYRILIAITIAASILYAVRGSFATIAVFAASGIISFLMTPLGNAAMSSFMNFLDRIEYSSGYWINREYYLVSGRIVTFLILSVISIAGSSVYDYALAIPALSFTVIGYLKILK
ncbi:MFS transporter [Thermoplasma acidophilum]|uniref:MFS transporter n=1 Tax=Thermoplasma acidophilum TaxID=2303 RepID=UPI001F524C82|nr:MFS transporter [Thermoplasma acidophilum]MCY0851614.1 MFS transporter [Thermoplasma acidophilum]